MKMKSKAILSLAAAIAAGVVSAGTFKWAISTDKDYDRISCRVFSRTKDANGKYLFRDVDDAKDATWFSANTVFFDEDGLFKFKHTDGNTYEVGYLRFNLYSGKTFLGSTSKEGLSYAGPTGGIISWEDVFDAIQNPEKGKYSMDIRSFVGYNQEGSSIGTFSIAPEPTSGLMLLLGAGMLALRRKRVRV